MTGPFEDRGFIRKRDRGDRRGHTDKETGFFKRHRDERPGVQQRESGNRRREPGSGTTTGGIGSRNRRGLGIEVAEFDIVGCHSAFRATQITVLESDSQAC
jgi:hypothetical protein